MRTFKVLVAMNSFKGSLSSIEATRLVAEGFERGYPEAHVVEMPMADGGDHTASVLSQIWQGPIQYLRVTGPYGDPVSAGVMVADGGKTVVIESASACGLALVPPGKRDAWTARSTGVGELMLWAARSGASRVIVGVGGTAMNDGAIGAVLAAGARVMDGTGCQVPEGIPGLLAVERVSLGGIPREFEGVEVIVLSDVSNPFAGEQGATWVYGPQKGLGSALLGKVDDAMERYGCILGRDLSRDPRGIPMAGAGGGLAGGIWAYFGARLEDGARFLMEESGFFREIPDADLVITGEGKVDRQTPRGKAPFALAQAAAASGVPVLVIGGGLDDSLLRSYPPEYAAVLSSTLRPSSTRGAMAMAWSWLPFISEQLAKVGRLFALSLPVRQEVCAGGIVIREGKKGREMLFVLDRFGKVVPPKGHLEPGEALEDAALREVKEETGIDGRITGDLGTIRYRFFGEDGPIEKRVQFYLMERCGGSPVPQQGETLDVMWIGEDQAAFIDTYDNMLPLIRRALEKDMV